MTDVVKRLADALDEEFCGTYGRASLAVRALATLTPGSTWTTEDGVEVMLVPVEADEEIYATMLSAIRK